MHGFVEVYRGSVATVHGRKLKWVAASASKELKGVLFEARIDINNQRWGGFNQSNILRFIHFWMIKNSYEKSWISSLSSSTPAATQLAFSSRNESPVGALLGKDVLPEIWAPSWNRWVFS